MDGKAGLELVQTMWSTSSAVGMGGEGCATAWGLVQRRMACGRMATVTFAGPHLARTMWSASSAVDMGGEGCTTAWGLAQRRMAWGGMAKVTVAVGDMPSAVKEGGVGKAATRCVAGWCSESRGVVQ